MRFWGVLWLAVYVLTNGVTLLLVTATVLDLYAPGVLTRVVFTAWVWLFGVSGVVAVWQIRPRAG